MNISLWFGFSFGALWGVSLASLIYIKHLKKIKCNICGRIHQKGNTFYCELCHIKEISDTETKAINGTLNAAKKLRDYDGKYIKELEHIRDCYYKDIAKKEEEKKIFRKVESI